MNRNRFHGIWAQFGRKVKERWNSRSDDPFILAAGRRDGFDARFREQCVILKRRADRQLAEFTHRHRNWQDLSER